MLRFRSCLVIAVNLWPVCAAAQAAPTPAQANTAAPATASTGTAPTSEVTSAAAPSAAAPSATGTLPGAPTSADSPSVPTDTHEAPPASAEALPPEPTPSTSPNSPENAPENAGAIPPTRLPSADLDSTFSTTSEPPEDPTARKHDGFYLRFGTGFGAWGEALRLVDSSEEVLADSTGIASLGNLDIGGNISNNWVLAFSLQTAELLASNTRVREESSVDPPEDVDPSVRSLVLAGVLAQWYQNPHRGLHVGGGLSFAGVAVPDNDDEQFDGDGYSAIGLGLTVEVGNTWWITDQWSVGLRGRGNLVLAGGEDDAGELWAHAISVSPGVLFDLVYH